jgi:hypothetical protein
VTGYHRHYAQALLRKGVPVSGPRLRRGGRPRVYGRAVEQALAVAAEATGWICGKRLVAALPDLVPALEREGALRLTGEERTALLGLSAATIDRRLAERRRRERPRGVATTKPGSLLKSQIPVRTYTPWDEQAPGFVEIDLVAHCGTSTAGEYVCTLTLVDIATGWTECAAIANKGQLAVLAALGRLRERLPFPLRGVDCDNGSEFLNAHLVRYCQAEQLTLTRCRAYHKNDQAHVEQKNGALVRRIIGYRRFEGMAAARELAALYARTRLFVNAFQPSFKLAEKERDGARVRKRYHPPATPCDRLLADPRTSHEVRRRVEALRVDLDPVQLLAEIRSGQQALVAIADSSVALPVDTPASPIPVADFLAGLRTAWRMGEVRPTAQPTLKPKRGRRRPDPLVAVTDELRSWFEADPAQTGSELLLRLQKSDPDRYPDALLRTVQRRLKIWRREIASRLVCGIPSQPPAVSISGTYA